MREWCGDNRAFLQIDPKNRLVPMMMKWLTTQARGNHWRSTKETAIAVLALAERDGDPDDPQRSLIDLNDAQAAFRLMARAGHIGKIVLTLRESSYPVQSAEPGRGSATTRTPQW